MLILLFGFIVYLTVEAASAGPQEGAYPAIRIDYCKGECDRKNRHLGDWRTEFLALPDGVVCDPKIAMIEGIKWVAANRPGFHWAGSACVVVIGQDI